MAKYRCGLIGWPVEHSLSPKLHAYAAKTRGIDLSYELFPVEPGEAVGMVTELQARGYKGLNVTTPHKEDVLDLIKKPDEYVQTLGAANTLSLERNQITGHNTDCSGVRQLIKDLKLDESYQAITQCKVIGAGPAGRAAAMGCSHALATCVGLYYFQNAPVLEGVPQIWFVSASKMEELREYMETPDGWYGSDLIINATPLGGGVRAHESPWPQGTPLPTHSWVMDLNYHPPVSRFLHDAQKAGNKTINGLGLLCYQAADSFNIWTGSDVTGKELFDYLITEGHDAALSDGR